MRKTLRLRPIPGVAKALSRPYFGSARPLLRKVGLVVAFGHLQPRARLERLSNMRR